MSLHLEITKSTKNLKKLRKKVTADYRNLSYIFFKNYLRRQKLNSN